MDILTVVSEFLWRWMWLGLPQRTAEKQECILQGNNYYLHAVPWMALLFLLLRSFLERHVFHWMGEKLCCMSEQCCSPPPHNELLREAFNVNRRPTQEEEESLSQEVGWPQYRVHKWFWRARNCTKASTLTKFKESSWRCVFYTAAVLNGVVTLTKEPFFWDLEKCYETDLTTVPSNSVQSYWCLEFAFYCSQLVSHISDVRRKDFLQSLLHHVATVALLCLCYFTNMLPLGALILLTHDLSDVVLELAKIFHYTRHERAAKATFVVFAVVFFITRLVIFPMKLIWSAAFSLPAVAGWFPGYREGMALLLLLQLLHLYWFWLVAGMAVKLVQGEGLKGDVRSDSELSSSS